MLLILTSPGDTHAEAVEQTLTQRGVPFIHWNQADFPEHDTVALRYGPRGGVTRTLSTRDATDDLTSITTTYVRRHAHPDVRRPAQDATARAYVENESRSFLLATAEMLECRWVPGTVRSLHFAGDKAWQLRLASRIGFEIPPTLITNDPDELLAFHQQHDGQLVCKALAFPHFNAAGASDDRWVFTTQLVQPRDIGYIDAVRWCPAIFQAYVPKRLELRVTVVGDRAFACAIHSQARARTRYDWRRYELGSTPHEVHQLPDDVAGMCVRIVAALGLCYGAMDLVLTPDGRYVFLEVNPLGQYLWIEKLTGMPITAAICDLLEAAEQGHGGMTSD